MNSHPDFFPKSHISETGPKDTPYENGFFVVDIELGAFYFLFFLLWL